MIIAIDGPAAAGKGTLARRLAQALGYHFLDTGSLYRMVAKSLLDRALSPDNVHAAEQAALALQPECFPDATLRTGDVGSAASVVAQIPQVRAALLTFQRTFARKAPGAVLDGRDIGTVVCPQADVKFYVTARAQVRAHRRLSELSQRTDVGFGPVPSLEDVLADIEARDARDANRATAPLTQAPDAIRLDTSDMDADDAFKAAWTHLNTHHLA